MKYYTFVFLFLSALSSIQSCWANKPPTIELDHWWASYSELSALNEIKKAFEKNNGVFEAIAVDRNTYVNSMIEQAKLGYLPAATHRLGGNESAQLKTKNLLLPIPAYLNGTPLKDILHKEVYDNIFEDDHILSLPVGIHLQNTAYYNKKIYDELSLTPPKNWPEFIEQAKQIKQAGYTPLAISNITWQVRNLLDSIMVGLKGSKFYLNFYDQQRSISNLRDDLIEVLEFYLSLKAYTDKNYENNKWNENIHALAQGKVAAYFLGDYSRGELVVKEKRLSGKDFYCDLAPGNQGVQIYGIDSFTLFNTDSEELKAGQNLLIKTVLDPQVQSAYISQKGGIPVRKDVVLENLDVCSAKIYSEWLSPDTLRLPYPGVYSRARSSILQNMVADLWGQEKPNVPEAVEGIIAAFDYMLATRKKLGN